MGETQEARGGSWKRGMMVALKDFNRQKRLDRRCQGGTSKEKVPGVFRKLKSLLV